MSKNFPATLRKYDLYVAFPEPFELGRVLFAGRNRRFVIREAFSREGWDAERALEPQGSEGRMLGVGCVDDRPNDEPIPLASGVAPPVPPEMKYFYGADYV